MRCPLADAHSYVEAYDLALGPHLVCVDCDHVVLLPDDGPELGETEDRPDIAEACGVLFDHDLRPKGMTGDLFVSRCRRCGGVITETPDGLLEEES